MCAPRSEDCQWYHRWTPQTKVWMCVCYVYLWLGLWSFYYAKKCQQLNYIASTLMQRGKMLLGDSLQLSLQYSLKSVYCIPVFMASFTSKYTLYHSCFYLQCWYWRCEGFDPGLETSLRQDLIPPPKFWVEQGCLNCTINVTVVYSCRC